MNDTDIRVTENWWVMTNTCTYVTTYNPYKIQEDNSLCRSIHSAFSPTIPVSDWSGYQYSDLCHHRLSSFCLDFYINISSRMCPFLSVSFSQLYKSRLIYVVLCSCRPFLLLVSRILYCECNTICLHSFFY